MTDTTGWIVKSAEELRQLLRGAGQNSESVLQDWLEHHPAFVPGYAGPRGMSGHRPWPSALITQPRLTGFESKVPDFCWLSIDSAEITAMMVEIEKPSKEWFTGDGQPRAELTQARSQITQWKSWFSNPSNVVRFLEEYLVPDDLKDLRFRQHYILVYGSSEEYAANPTLTSLKANLPADDETFMSFDRLPELAKAEFARYGCVRRSGHDFSVKAIPETWDPSILTERALRVTHGYEQALAASSIGAARKAELLRRLRKLEAEPLARPYRFRPVPKAG